MMKNLDAREGPCVDSRQRVSFRTNRIQYVFVFLTALLLLSGGVAASILALYPQAELELRESLGNDIKEIEAEIEGQEKIVADSAKPDYEDTLRKRVQAAKAAADQSNAQLREYLDQAPYTGGWLQRMEDATDVDEATELAGQLDDLFEGCPDNSTEFDSETCLVLEKHASGLARIKLDQLKAVEAYAAARDTADAADTAADEAKEELSRLQERLTEAKEQYDANSLLKFDWVKSHLSAAAAVLVPTLLAVIAYVWVGAILADVISWLIMMMMALERGYADDGERGPTRATAPAQDDAPVAEEEGSPPDGAPRDMRKPWAAA